MLQLNQERGRKIVDIQCLKEQEVKMKMRGSMVG